MKSLAKSLTVWLNFLFENPRSCGCEDGGENEGERKVGKRENFMVESECVSVNGGLRLPKRQRENEVGVLISRSKKKFAGLWNSLKDICSFDDLELRLREYLSYEACMEVFTVMSQVTKVWSYIDMFM